MRQHLLALAAMALLLAACHGGDTIEEVRLISPGEIAWDVDTPVLVVHDADTLTAVAHYRGGWSRRFYKHSVALKYDTPTQLCGMPADRKWVLNANYIDRSFMRHKLCYDLFRSMDSANRAPRCQYVWLNIDGVEQGLYVAMQKPDRQMLGLRRADTCAAIFKEPPLLYPTLPTPQDSLNPLNQKYPNPKHHSLAAQHQWLRWFVFESTDSMFAAVVDSVFDLRNIADYQLLVMFTNNADAVLKGYYLYRTGSNCGWRLSPWDFDHSFGRDGDAELNMLERPSHYERSMLFSRLMQLPTYRALLRSRWQQHRATGVISEKTISRMVDQNAHRIRHAVQRNNKIWPTTVPDYPDTSSFSHEVQIIKQFTHQSIAHLDSVMLAL